MELYFKMVKFVALRQTSPVQQALCGGDSMSFGPTRARNGAGRNAIGGLLRKLLIVCSNEERDLFSFMRSMLLLGPCIALGRSAAGGRDVAQPCAEGQTPCTTRYAPVPIFSSRPGDQRGAAARVYYLPVRQFSRQNLTKFKHLVEIHAGCDEGTPVILVVADG